ncbi:MAG TPA: hypothetical protein HPP87_04840 [Planctomycetes bacterium]|nr:hypothetical protein [Planctomycetota bacterium]
MGKKKRKNGEAGQKQDPVEIARKQRHIQLLDKVRQGRALGKAEIAELAELEAASQTAAGVPAKLDPADVCRSQVEAAAFTGVTQRTIRRWKAEGMPVTKYGHYPKYILIEWAARGKDGAGEAESDKARLRRAEADLKEVKAQHAKLLLEIEQGEWVRREEVETKWVEMTLAFKRALLGAGRKLAGKWAGPAAERRKIEALINAEVREILGRLAKK